MAIPACPDCAHNFDAQFDSTDADGRSVYVCDAAHGGTGPTLFSAPATPAGMSLSARPEAVVKAELGVTDDLLGPLLTCLVAADGFTEFGVIEHRLSQRFREVFARHVHARGHHMFGDKETTASGARVSMALRRLETQGLVAKRYPGFSTGAAWRHTPKISYWALAPASKDAPTLTWSHYCQQLGRSDDWIDQDRAGLSSPSQVPG